MLSSPSRAVLQRWHTPGDNYKDWYSLTLSIFTSTVFKGQKGYQSGSSERRFRFAVQKMGQTTAGSKNTLRMLRSHVTVLSNMCTWGPKYLCLAPRVPANSPRRPRRPRRRHTPDRLPASLRIQVTCGKVSRCAFCCNVIHTGVHSVPRKLHACEIPC